MGMSGPNREVALVARVLPQSLHDVLDDPHPEVGLLNFLLCTLDLQIHLSRDQPPQVPQKLFVLDPTGYSVSRGQFV